MAKTAEELQDAADDAAMQPKKVQTSAGMIEMPSLAEQDDHLDRKNARRPNRLPFAVTRSIPPGTTGPCSE